ncbi:MAG TPA: PhoH family protein [Candidatus Hydrogenedens sp.]|nr:PhoH family protein [Candidatus Hydrogenedens sp.]
MSKIRLKKETASTYEIVVQNHDELIKLLGVNGEIRKRVCDQTRVQIIDRGEKVLLIGENEETRKVSDILNHLLFAVRKGYTPTPADFDLALEESPEIGTPPIDEETSELYIPSVTTTTMLRPEIKVQPRSEGQMEYIETIRHCEMTFVIGPAGTGKTYLAMAAAVSALLNKQVRRLVLTRPAVEAGENLGYLPGAIEEKVHPYLRPLYDALYSMVDYERIQRWIEQERIEVAPLAFMRGRSLDHAFVILDEAQNTTSDQMLMFLTRLGEGSRAIITGDITQIDLPKGKISGLVESRRILEGIPGIGIVHLTKRDVVRHPLVQRIIDAYESHRRHTQNSENPQSDEKTE